MSHRVLGRAFLQERYICARCVWSQLSNASRVRAFHATSRTEQKQQSNLLDLLEERGYVSQIAGDRNALHKLLRTKKVGFYAGVDPTAPSLHLGHLLPLMTLFWVSLYGHHAVSLVGGATARVGDPSGRLTSRAKTTDDAQVSNASAMYSQTSQLWRTAMRYAYRHGYDREERESHTLLNNADWLAKLNVLDFLRVLGNGMRIGTMLGRDTVKNKMEKGDGMSFSEFTYPLLQGWDWWHMYSKMGVQVQIGGSDQYGNIVAGLDAVKYIAQAVEDNASRPEWLDAEGRLKEDHAPMGLTVPLLTAASGEKFGKSAGNAIWLDRNMTSPFDLYGFLLRSADTDVERYLKLFTFVRTTAITHIMKEHLADPGKRKAQHLLATEVLELVHGREEAERTRAEHEAMRNPTLASLTKTVSPKTGEPTSGQQSAAEKRIVLPKSLVRDTPLGRILYHAGLAASKSEGARTVQKGGVYIAVGNGAAGEHEGLSFVPAGDQSTEKIAHIADEGRLILRLGKWKVRVIEVVDDDEFETLDLDVPGWTEFKTAVKTRLHSR